MLKKGTPPEGVLRILRFIVNLMPSNQIQIMIEGDLRALPTSMAWHYIHIPEGHILVADQEDIKSCFHVFSLPAQWRPSLSGWVRLP